MHELNEKTKNSAKVKCNGMIHDRTQVPRASN